VAIAGAGAQRRAGVVLAVSLIATAIALWAWLAFRTVNPIVLADEYWYWMNGASLAHPARLAALHNNAVQPGAPLFERYIHVLTRLGLQVDVWVKLLNLACLAAGFGLLACTFRSFGRQGLLLLMVSLFLAEGTYAAYVMPECLYFALFSLMVVLARTANGDRSVLAFSSVAIAAALLTLTKSHGLMVFGAFLVAAAVWSLRQPRERWTAQALALGAALVVYMAGVRLGGRALAPADYGAVAKIYFALPAWRSLTLVHLGDDLSRLIIYLSAMGFLFAPSLIHLAFATFKDLARPGAPPSGQALSRLLLLAGLGLVCVVVVVLLDDQPDRIHLRYVSFAFPWVLMLGLEASEQLSPADREALRTPTAIVWLLSGLSFLSVSHWLRPLPVDSPLLFFLYRNGEFGAFGLGGFALFYGALVAVGAPTLLFLTSWRWTLAQALLLALVTPLAAWNVAHWQHVASADAAALRRLGKEAIAACGRPEEVEAVGTSTNFVALYTSLAEIGLGARFRLLDEVPAAAELAAPGPRCFLTPLKPAPRGYRLIDERSNIGLYQR